MALKGLDHVAIAVEKLEPALEVYCRLFGWTNEAIEVVEDQQARVARLVNGPAHDRARRAARARVDRPQVPRPRGPGLHHLCFEVEGLEQMLAALVEGGRAPRRRDAAEGRARPQDRLRAPGLVRRRPDRAVRSGAIRGFDAFDCGQAR